MCLDRVGVKYFLIKYLKSEIIKKQSISRTEELLYDYYIAGYVNTTEGSIVS